MKYILRVNVHSKIPEIEITIEEYIEFEKAYNILNNALAMEEKYEILISNYLTFEKQILNITTSYMVGKRLDYSDFFDVRLSLNTCLVNILTAARLYVDQLNQNVRECVPNNPNIKETVKKLFESEYDNNKEYRFMEALRNYVQHRGIPVHLTQQGSRFLESNNSIEYYMNIYSQRTYFENDPCFKKIVLGELGERIDLKLATRAYIDSMSNVHESARFIVAESVTKARSIFEDAHRYFATIYSGSLVGLCACKQPAKGQLSVIPLLLGWDDIRKKLQNRNSKLLNLRKSYVTGNI